MANTLTELIPTFYTALDVLLSEPTGFIGAVMMDGAADQVAKDQTISWPIVPSQDAADVAAAATGPDPDDRTITPGTMTIDKARSVTFYIEGEEQKALGSAMSRQIFENQVVEAMRTLRNEIEADIASLYKYASRAYGTAGTTPFASDHKALAQVRKILLDNGAPMNDLQCVLNTAAGANLRSLTTLTNVNESGSEQPIRNGVILPLHGFKVRESAQTKTHTKGTGTGFKVDLTAGYAKGKTLIHIDTGIGTLLTGDVIQNIETGRDSEKYVVKTGGTGATGATDIDMVLSDPGLMAAWLNNDDFTIQDSYAANMCFSREAIALMTRVPAMPEGGDFADDVTVVSDPKSGLSFQIAVYRQRRRVAYEVAIAWGKKLVKPNAVALLLG